MHKAKIKDFDKISYEFKKYGTVFPHIRSDYLKRQIKNKNVIFENGVILIFNKYKRRGKLGTTEYNKGDVIIHQILNSKVGNGNASRVFKKFCSLTTKCRLLLTVRSSNRLARRFYERQNMKIEGDISWKNNTIGGKIYAINV